MKYIVSLLFFLTLTLSNVASAGFYDSEYFEPTVLCGVAGFAMYSSAEEGDEATQGAIGCALGAVAGVIINKYYKKKIYTVHENKINNLKREVNQRVVRQAQKAYSGDVDEYFALEAEQIIESQEMPGGEVLSPTKRIILKSP